MAVKSQAVTITDLHEELKQVSILYQSYTLFGIACGYNTIFGGHMITDRVICEGVLNSVECILALDCTKVYRSIVYDARSLE
jgi:ubiquitin C-terminal hydrolase